MRGLVVGPDAAAGWCMKVALGLGLGLAVALLAGTARAEGAVGGARRPVGRVGRLWTWEELTVSAAAVRLGLANVPTPEAMRNLEWLVHEVLDPLRARWPGVRVTSGYRSVAVNRAVGGVAGSLHLRGLAVDLTLPHEERHSALASGVAMTTGLSVGYVVWLVRGGVLVSSMLSALPAWQLIDPMPVLAAGGSTKRQRSMPSADEPEVERLFGESTRASAADRSHATPEARLAAAADPADTSTPGASPDAVRRTPPMAEPNP